MKESLKIYITPGSWTILTLTLHIKLLELKDRKLYCSEKLPIIIGNGEGSREILYKIRT